MNRSRSRVRVNIYILSDEKKCGRMTTYGVTLFHVGGGSVVEEGLGLLTKGRMNFMCGLLYLEFGGSFAAELKGVVHRR